jgi:amino acid permease
MMLSFFLTLLCMIKLLECKAKTPGGSFTDIGKKALGMKGKYMVDIFLSAAQLGFVTAYIYFIITSLSQVIKDSFGEDVDYRWFGKRFLTLTST